MSRTRVLSFTLALIVLLAGLQPVLAAVSDTAAGPDVAPVISYKIITTGAGLVQVTYANLTAAGFNPTGIDTDTFQLSNDDVEVAFFLYDGGDQSFDPGDYFLFYAEAKLTRYTNTNVYWFTAGQEARLLPSSQNGAPGAAPLAPNFWRTVHFEQDKVYKSALPLTGDADRWYWIYFKACPTGDRTCNDADGRKDTRSLTANLPHLSSTPHTATLSLVLRGQTNDFPNPDHHFLTSVNNTQVGNSYFDGQISYSTSLDVASSLLVSGNNTIRFNIPADLSGASNDGYINFFDITYRSDFVAEGNSLTFGAEAGAWQYQISNFSSPNIMAFDITDPKQPVMITGLSVGGGGPFSAAFEATGLLQAASAAASNSTFYVVATPGWQTPTIMADALSDLHATTNGADYIVISHTMFLAQAQQLATYRATANGFRTAVIDVQDIYDEFNGGLMDAEAIRDFISYASHFWQPPRPQYVVLFGDGHYDFLNFLASNEPVYMPPYLLGVDPFQGETAADNRFVDVFGDEQDDSDGDATNTARGIAISNGFMDLAVDFGFHPVVVASGQVSSGQVSSGSAAGEQAGFGQSSQLRPELVKAFGDKVWWDEDRDGVYDANERGAPGVTVNLRQGGVVVLSQTTDANGGYSFEDIGSGAYELEFVPPAGWQFTARNVSGPDCLAAHNDPVICDRYDSDPDPGTGLIQALNYIYPQQVQDNWDAGIVRPGTIGNRVWLDSNGDGLQDAVETGIAGVLVELLQNNVVIASTSTDGNGLYYFYDLPDGVYDVRIASSNFSGGVLDGLFRSDWDQGVDLMPDLSLGRFPVNTVVEAQEMVNRTLAYQLNAPPGDWNKHIVFVSDNPDGAGDFYAHSNEVADDIWPYPSGVEKVYYQQTYPTSTTAKAAIINGINQGALFVTYNGHASKRTWGDQLFDTVDVDALGNTIFPIFLPMTCLEGQYINPGFTSMGEKAVRTIGKGAVATFSPTGLGVATGHQFLYNQFFESLVYDGETQIGPLTVDAKHALFESHSLFKDLLDTYVLFGDPALLINTPQPDVAITKTVQPAGTVSPGDTITYTLTYTNVGQLDAPDVVITDLLPGQISNPAASSNPPLTPNPGTTFVWPVGTLTPGAGGTVTIVATVNANTPAGSQIVNTARIDTSGNDTNLSNNESTVTTPVAAPITLSGKTWYDVNGNGNLDGGETLPVVNVPISITRVSTGDVFTTQSDSNGNWQMGGLPPGTYQIKSGMPPFLARTTSDTLDATVPGGGAAANLNFGFISPTAVELASFRAVLGPEGAAVTWTTRSEQDISGWYVWRSADPEKRGMQISEMIFAGGVAEGSAYSYTDEAVNDLGWHYWLEAVAANGEKQFFGPVQLTPDDGNAGSQKVFFGLVLG